MNPSSQHLSDEAVAAFADGVLCGLARARATRHTAACTECAEAVRVQREAAAALRAAPAPELPTELLARLCGLPQVTPLEASAPPATVVMPDGTTMFATAGRALGTLAAPAAALVPSPERPRHRGGSLLTAATLAVVTAGTLAVGAVATTDDDPTTGGVGVNTVGYRGPAGAGVSHGPTLGVTDASRTGLLDPAGFGSERFGLAVFRAGGR
ncbi:hypothetical protein SAMN05443575_3584 [Jatrophihabitans endophyticus]|uniref:Zinc-finger n=1 Tax=Jatrophihabitans endophyticus TaxID=1206085 RepID=A0A1M5RLC5_9ACTN|nr:hypothetical protein [Jatrophihabitans endophyticus]SHH27124.1 hypothetical protein SAMN05443575_3584 [Jatrophihabitans endophyticus]